MARTMRCPGNCIHIRLVPLQLHHRKGRKANIKHNNLSTVHYDCCHVPRSCLFHPRRTNGVSGSELS
ncbi:hypothetical protein Lalb_Chr14g0364191 [Lupinus albus]|uniref:Uncharacterized protein n=1 Tax=Lupinus albus TaxID=3870 RepID=A0A6A4PEJ0_LUPAL|nr:hypothetical protein Lalb_Chr14g0364191 [Lupinus albus]